MVQGRGFPSRGVGGRAGCRLACRGQAAGRHCGRDGLIEFFDEAAAGRRARRSAHRPGRVLADVAVMLAR
jgi:hypothetical protein